MKYTKHEHGIESECGQYVLENLEECMEELNELLKQREEARSQAVKWRERSLMCTPWSTYENDKKLPWDNEREQP